MRKFSILIFVACAIVSAALIVLLRSIGNHSTVSVAPTPASGAMRSEVAGGQGAYPGSPKVGLVSDNLPQFKKASGIYPSIDVRFVNWSSPFPAAQIREDHGLGMTTMMVLEPRGTSLAGLANGDDDAYLRSWGRADRQLGLPVILSFAPEANGSWYRWGSRHISPALYRNMWHRVHNVMLRAGARSITWLWQVSVVFPSSEALQNLWPGSKDVSEVGVDGQLKSARDTFASVFGQTVTQLRGITRDPVMISEVAVRSGPARPTQITGLFDGVRRARLAALILFDAHAKWRIDGDPAALKAFRTGVREYAEGTGS